ncbi:MAG: hypothetical protein Q9217_004981 [Psora testacea]
MNLVQPDYVRDLYVLQPGVISVRLIIIATCPPNPGLSQSYYEIDFTKINSQPSDWHLADYSNVTYNTRGNTGAEFSFLEQHDAPTMGTNFYFLFGRVEFVVQAAPGSGIVSSMILFSDDLDEIDWEFRGSYDTIVQTNWFGRGIYGDYSHWTAPTVSTAFSAFHTYALDWSPTELVWSIDGKPVRSLKASDCKGGAGTPQQYPTGPMKVSLGLWDPGDPDNYNSWGGGKTPIPPPAGGYSMYVKSVKIWNTFPAQQYTYTDKAGNWGSIKATNQTLPSSSPVPSSTSAASFKPSSQSSKSSTASTAQISSSTKSLGEIPQSPTSSMSNIQASPNSMILHRKDLIVVPTSIAASSFSTMTTVIGGKTIITAVPCPSSTYATPITALLATKATASTISPLTKATFAATLPSAIPLQSSTAITPISSMTTKATSSVSASITNTVSAISSFTGKAAPPVSPSTTNQASPASYPLNEAASHVSSTAAKATSPVSASTTNIASLARSPTIKAASLVTSSKPKASSPARFPITRDTSRAVSVMGKATSPGRVSNTSAPSPVNPLVSSLATKVTPIPSSPITKATASSISSVGHNSMAPIAISKPSMTASALLGNPHKFLSTVVEPRPCSKCQSGSTVKPTGVLASAPTNTLPSTTKSRQSAQSSVLPATAPKSFAAITEYSTKTLSTVCSTFSSSGKLLTSSSYMTMVMPTSVHSAPTTTVTDHTAKTVSTKYSTMVSAGKTTTSLSYVTSTVPASTRYGPLIAVTDYTTKAISCTKCGTYSLAGKTVTSSSMTTVLPTSTRIGILSTITDYIKETISTDCRIWTSAGKTFSSSSFVTTVLPTSTRTTVAAFSTSPVPPNSLTEWTMKTLSTSSSTFSSAGAVYTSSIPVTHVVPAPFTKLATQSVTLTGSTFTPAGVARTSAPPIDSVAPVSYTETKWSTTTVSQSGSVYTSAGQTLTSASIMTMAVQVTLSPSPSSPFLPAEKAVSQALAISLPVNAVSSPIFAAAAAATSPAPIFSAFSTATWTVTSGHTYSQTITSTLYTTTTPYSTTTEGISMPSGLIATGSLINYSNSTNTGVAAASATPTVPFAGSVGRLTDQMTISYDSVLSSPPIKFFIGPNRKLYTVHSALIAYHSKPLNVLVNGEMKEAKEGCTPLEEVDEQTFVRFTQYAYTGDYVTADPEILLDSSAIATTDSAQNEAPPDLNRPDVVAEWVPAEDEPEEPPEIHAAFDELGWGSSQISEKDKKEKGHMQLEWAGVKSKKSKLWTSFRLKEYGIFKPASHVRKNREACEDYTVVFLCHARLYAFADKYDIEHLKRLSLGKLHQTLVTFTPYEERIDDIVELLHYSYSNTPDRPDSKDDLRQLIIHYAACVVEYLSRNAKFQLLLEEHGSLAKDLLMQMLDRLD